jgi:hypothetical protein
MAEAYFFNQWNEAPGGCRFSLANIDDELWMPLSEAIEALSHLPPPSVMPLRQYFAWRCSQGLISAKAGILEQRFGDDREKCEYRNMPITEEWASNYWSADHGEHWSTNTARIVSNGPTGRQVHRYLEIAVDREGVDLFRQLILAQNEPSPHAAKRSLRKPRKKPGPAPDPDWPDAIKKVAGDCIAAGYKKPLKRGDKAAIQNLLLNAMAEKNKHPSEDTARKYAEEVIDKLPDNSN